MKNLHCKMRVFLLIKYKRCSCCKNPAKFIEDDFCGNCGAKLDLAQPPKGE